MRKRNLLMALLTIGLGASLVWGYNQYSMAQQLTLRQENQYQQAYRDMVFHVETMENFFAKALGSGSNSNNLIHLTGSWQEANAALVNLSSLPVDNPGSSHIAQFLNQAGEFSYVLAQRLAGGGNIKPEESQMLVNMHETARKTSEDLNNLLGNVETNGLTWTNNAPNLWQRASGWFTGKAEADTTDATQPVTVSQGLQLLDSQLQKLPPFEYEGKFTGTVTQSPKGLPPEELSKEQAQESVNRFLNQVGVSYNLQYQGDAQGLLPTYTYNDANNQDVSVEASKRGGLVVLFDDTRDIGERTLSLDQAKAKAQTYLKNLGYPSMYLTSSEDHGAYLTLSYVVQEDGVRIYPDKVIMRIAMDNGQLVGYNARPYLFFHQSRSIGKPKLSVSQARNYLKKNLKVTDTALVLLAKDNYAEILCYEFRGTMDSEEFLIYINAASGFEEQMYRVLKTPEGDFLK